MSERLVKLTMTDGVAQVTLDRPARRNALTRELLTQLSATVAEAAANPTTRLRRARWERPGFLCRDGSRRDAAARLGPRRPGAVGTGCLGLSRRARRHSASRHADAGRRARAGDRRRIWNRAGLRPGACHAQRQVFAAGSQAGNQPGRRFSAACFIESAMGRPCRCCWKDARSTARKRIVWESATICRRPSVSLESRQELVASLLAGAPQALAVTKRLVRSFALEQLIRQLEAGRKVSAEARAFERSPRRTRRLPRKARAEVGREVGWQAGFGRRPPQSARRIR